MHRIYIAGPYTHGVVSHNVRRAIDIGMKIGDLGFIPIIPHLNHLIDFVTPRSYDYWLAEDMELLRDCDALFRLPGHSPGAEKEIEFCNDNNIPVFDEHSGLINWFGEDNLEARMNHYGMYLAGGALTRQFSGEPGGDLDFWGPCAAVHKAYKDLSRCTYFKPDTDSYHINPTFKSMDNSFIFNGRNAQLCTTGPIRTEQVAAQFDIRACALYRYGPHAPILEAVPGAKADANAKHLNILNRGVNTIKRVDRYIARGWTLKHGKDLLDGPITKGFVITY